MSAETKVDVLGRFDATIQRLKDAAADSECKGGALLKDIYLELAQTETDSRNAVAELIDAATDARDTLHSCIDALSSEEQDDHDALDRLTAALARVGGAP
ncbi:MAG: hypothetical protein GAK28_03193 [Luteibacter sp.]|uniref:hypothetical protein n=1 Tax=Luteibacter sp. TaxID=1886636 RepID=UPI00137E0F5C|nr:hypothetical protein [Luteibacter sp.]KAF1005441.1 MAG: hypothetical protein GAK28_03193 [Luteibacter sp.]